MRWLHGAYLTVHFLAVCCITVVWSLLRPRHLNNTSECARLMSWALPVLGVRKHIKNEHPKNCPQAIYVVNHQDTLDVFICSMMLPDNIAILGKSSLRYVPFFGLAFWLAGNIYINRGNRSKAWNTMAKVAETIQKRGCSVYIFPEGTRSRGRGLQKFKSGAFALAIRSGLPIVPIVFSSTHKHIDLGRWKAGEAAGIYLEPIATTGMSEEDIPTLQALTHERMREALAQLDAELAQQARS